MIILKWLDYYSTCFSGIHFMDINHDYVVLLYVHWYTRTPLYQILSLLHCHPYRPTDTLNTVLHVTICYTIPLFHVVSPLHRYWDSRHYYCMFVNYWYTDMLVHWIPSCARYFMFLHHCYIDSPVYMH